MIALGHDMGEKGYGVGPNINGCGSCCWLFCCFGGPCNTPQGIKVATEKSKFNATVKPKVGKGISR